MLPLGCSCYVYVLINIQFMPLQLQLRLCICPSTPINLPQTAIYPKHQSTPNINLPPKKPHQSINPPNIRSSQAGVHSKHPSNPSICPTQASVHYKHLSRASVCPTPHFHSKYNPPNSINPQHINPPQHPSTPIMIVSTNPPRPHVYRVIELL